MSIDTDNIFLQATKRNLVFPSIQGDLIVQDLWTIKKTSTNKRIATLENVYAGLNKRKQELDGAGSLFSTKKSPEQETVDLQLEIVKAVAQVRTAEDEAKAKAAAIAQERKHLQDLIYQKQTEGASVEELQKRLAALSS
jgi:uncharacterized small protein (DUF1192 family)